MQPHTVTEVIGRKRYSTEMSTLVASDAYWDGRNWERRGRNTFLYRTPNGSYFKQVRSQWQGEPTARIEPLCEDAAVALWEELPEREVSFGEAFPNVVVWDA